MLDSKEGQVSNDYVAKKFVENVLDIFRNGGINQNQFHIALYILTLRRLDIIKSDSSILDTSKLLNQVSSYIRNNDNSTRIFTELIESIGPLKDTMKIHCLEQIKSEVFAVNDEILGIDFPLFFDRIKKMFEESFGAPNNYSIPPEIIALIKNEVGLIEGRFFNPFANAENIAVEFKSPDVSMHSQISYRESYQLSLMRAIAYGVFSGTLENTNSLFSWPLKIEFDCIISMPPFGKRIKKEDRAKIDNYKTVEEFIISKGLKSLSKKGKIILFLPQRFLFSSQDRSTREKLVEKGLIDKVFTFPSGIINNTGVKTCLLIIDLAKDQSRAIQFIDASEYLLKVGPRKNVLDYKLLISNFSVESDSNKFVENESIKEFEYRLTPDIYFLEKVTGRKFTEVFKRIRGEKKVDKTPVKIVRYNDLISNDYEFELDIDSLIFHSSADKLRKDLRKIDQSCMLFSTIGNSLSPTYFHYKGEEIYVSSYILSYTFDDAYFDTLYLTNELKSNYVKNQLDAFSYGTSMRRIAPRDLESIRIKVSSFSDQKAKAEALLDISGKIAKLESERNRLSSDIEIKSKNEISSIRHTFRQYLSSAILKIKGTKVYLAKNNGKQIDLEMIFSKNLNQTIGDHLDSTLGILNDMSVLLQRFGMDHSGPSFESNSLIKLVESAQQKFEAPGVFEFEELHFDYLSFDEGDDYKPMIKMKSEDFDALFSDIISNAKSHGFKDRVKQNKIRCSVSFDSNTKNCVLSIENNGHPAAVGFDQKRLEIKGEKTVSSTGSGIGGANIKYLIDIYKGTLNWINDPSLEYPVSYIISLPLDTDFI